MKYPSAVPCKGCGKPIVWATDPAGKSIPLDTSVPVYTITEPEGSKPVCARHWNGAVNHFATCPNANDFNKRAKTESRETKDPAAMLANAPGLQVDGQHVQQLGCMRCGVTGPAEEMRANHVCEQKAAAAPKRRAAPKKPAAAPAAAQPEPEDDSEGIW